MPKSLIIPVVMACALMGAFGQVLFKQASSELQISLPGLLNLKLIGGMALYGIAMVLFIYSLRFGNLSALYPIIATSYIWVAIFSGWFLKEPISWNTWVGTIIIIIGIVFIHYLPSTASKL